MSINFINKYRILPLSLLALLILIGLLASNHSEVLSRSGISWSPQQRVVGYANETLPPYLVADRDRTVHAFTSQWVGDNNPQLAVVYNQWTLEIGWTPVVDIILSPLEQARVMGAFLDAQGMMHLIFFGGDDRYANIYYTTAPAVDAGRATVWKRPQLIGRDAITPSTASLAGDKHGNLVVIYSGRSSGNGVYSIYSADSGSTWSEISPIYLTNNDALYPYGIHTYLGYSGWLHAVWTVSDQRGHNQSGHYAQLDTETWEWVDPIEFDQGIGIDQGMGIANPAVIEHNGEVFIMYNNGNPPSGVPPAQWYIQSNDFGNSWTVPVRPFTQHVGRNGVTSLLVDGDGKLIVIFADRIPTTYDGVYDEINGVWHSSWINGSWNEPEEIVAMSRAEYRSAMLSNPNLPHYLPYDVQAVISQGNVLLATWRTDPGYVRNGVWFSYRELDSSELPIHKLPGSVGYLNSSPQEGLDENHQETMQPDGGDEIGTNIFWDDRQEPVLQNSLTTVIIMSTIPVGVMILLIYVSRLKK